MCLINNGNKSLIVLFLILPEKFEVDVYEYIFRYTNAVIHIYRSLYMNISVD